MMIIVLIKLDYYFTDVSTSTTYKFFHTNVPADSHDNAVHNALVLEEGDYLQFQAEQQMLYLVKFHTLY
jgi:hypothetical protein